MAAPAPRGRCARGGGWGSLPATMSQPCMGRTGPDAGVGHGWQCCAAETPVCSGEWPAVCVCDAASAHSRVRAVYVRMRLPRVGDCCWHYLTAPGARRRRLRPRRARPAPRMTSCWGCRLPRAHQPSATHHQPPAVSDQPSATSSSMPRLLGRAAAPLRGLAASASACHAAPPLGRLPPRRVSGQLALPCVWPRRCARQLKRWTADTEPVY